MKENPSNNLLKLINQHFNWEMRGLINIGFNLDTRYVHKILYFTYGIFYGLTGEELFEPNFEAHRTGPCQENINDIYWNNKEKSLQNMLDIVLIDLIRHKTTDDLILLSHTTKPWADAWKGPHTPCEKISKLSINNYFIKHWKEFLFEQDNLEIENYLEVIK